MTEPQNIQLGDVCHDTITGFEGVAIARTEWLNNCVRWMLQPKVTAEGTIPEAQSFDEPNLIVVIHGPRHEAVRTGGPRPEPKRTVLK